MPDPVRAEGDHHRVARRRGRDRRHPQGADPCVHAGADVAAVGNVGARYVANPESVGRPLSPVIEVGVAGDDGSPVPTGEVGEIWLKGPTVVRGYFGLDEELPRDATGKILERVLRDRLVS